MKFSFSKFYILSVIILLLNFQLNAQVFQWAKNMGSSSNDVGQSIATDAFGNVYTTGNFLGSGDFDPGAGTFSLTSLGSYDIFISKLDASGNFVWAKQIGGSGVDLGKGIKVDASGNVYITGSFQNAVDFDPNAGVTTLTSAGNNDIFVLKLNASGNFVWAKNMGGTNDDKGLSLTTDASGNIYTTGYFMSTGDFDPSAATYTLGTIGGNQDGFISKLDASGNFVWAKQFKGTGSSLQFFGNGITLDASGNVCLGGSFIGQYDFDPGVATFTMNAINMDICICKLDGSGNFIWARQMGSVGGSNTANSVITDASNNIYSTGYFSNTTDFDPGAGTYTLSGAGTSLDIYVLKLDASGNFIWAKQMGGPGSDEGKSLSLSPGGDIYSTGYYSNTADFDPSASTYTLNTIGGNAIYISKLDPFGNFAFAYGFGYSNCSGNSISVDITSDIHTTGNFDQNTDFDPGSGTFTLTPNGGVGSSDVFVHKMSQSICPTFTLNSSSGSYTLMCAITSQTLNAVSTSSISGVTFMWTAPSLATTSGASYIATASGIYTVSSSAPSNTCMVTQTLSIIQTTGNVSYNVLTTGSTCNSNGSATVSIVSGTAPYTYTWSTGSNASSTSSLAPGNYSVIVKDANQCTATQTFAVNNSAPTFSSVPICFVTVDSLSQYNVITWDKTLFPTADSFFVYRETGTNVYQKIGSQPYSTLSRFIDTVRTLYFPNTGDPNVGTYRYKLKTRDNCGNMSAFSPYHNTLFTINTSGTFSWTQLYTIEGDPNPVLSYVLERDNNSTGNWAAVGSVAGTQNFIIDPNYSTYALTGSWRIKTQWGINCTPTEKVSTAPSVSYSNKIKNNNIGIKENSTNTYLDIFPNPISCGRFIVKISSNQKSTVEVRNLIGEIVYQGNLEKEKTMVDIGTQASGVYFVIVKNEKEQLNKKIIIE